MMVTAVLMTALIEHLMCARNCYKCFADIYSQHPYAVGIINNPIL